MRIFKRCPHERVRCVHGDEIIHRNFRRRACLNCGKSLDGPLPIMCFLTNEPHYAYNNDRLSWASDVKFCDFPGGSWIKDGAKPWRLFRKVPPGLNL